MILSHYLSIMTGCSERRNFMEFNSFARIGKGVLSKAIGLQKNYVEEYVKVSDEINIQKSNCYDCPIHKLKQSLSADGFTNAVSTLDRQCSSCSSVVYEPAYEIRYRYINEKNRYGYQPTLKSNAIKLLLLYHFLQPDANGFVKNVSLKALAETIGCTVPTIVASNKILSDYSYCFVCNSGLAEKHINVYLPEYKNYHKTANEGGRGYITFSYEMMQEILHFKTLNTLRLNLKGILEVDQASLRDGNLAETSTDYKKLRGFLPSYCKNNIIRNALLTDNSIFHCSFTETSVVFSIGSKFSQKNLRNELLEETKTSLVNYVSDLNDMFEVASSDTDVDQTIAIDMIATQGIRRNNYYPTLLLNGDDYSSLSSMSLQYNLNIVRSAIIEVYNSYILHEKPVLNFGALVRTVIRSHISKVA